MFYCPYAEMYGNYYRAMQMDSGIRVFHASPNAPAVDVYANGNPIVRNLAYKKISQYIPVPSGNYNISVYPAGKTTNPVINTNVFVPPNSIFNVAAIGTLPNISLYPIQEPNVAQTSGNACVRVVHLSPNAPAVDIKLADGTTVFSDVSYKEVTKYVCVPAGTYSFNVSPTGTNTVVLSVPNVQLKANSYYTIYAIGLVGESPALEALAVLEPR